MENPAPAWQIPCSPSSPPSIPHFSVICRHAKLDRLLIKKLNKVGLIVCPGGMSLVTGHQLSFGTLMNNTLWGWWFSQFSIHLIVHLSRQESITWTIRTLWKTMGFLKSSYIISRHLFILLLGSLPCLSTIYILSFCIRIQQGVPYFKPYSFLLRKDEITPYQRD